MTASAAPPPPPLLTLWHILIRFRFRFQWKHLFQMYSCRLISSSSHCICLGLLCRPGPSVRLSGSWRWAVSVDKREIPEGQKGWREKRLNLNAKGSDWERSGKSPPVLCSRLITDSNRKQRFVLKRGQNALWPHFHEWKEPSGGRRSVNNSGLFSGVQIQVLNTGLKHESPLLKLRSPLTSTCSSLHVTQHHGGGNNIWPGWLILRQNNNAHKWFEERH